jgi:signal transduction histidine kinase
VGLSYREWTQYHAINTAAQQTRDVLETVDSIRSYVLDAETSQRGFLLTGDPTYLEPYNRALQKTPAELVKLETVMALQHDGTAQVAVLTRLVRRKFADMADSIDLRRRERTTPSVETVLGDPGKRLMDRIRAVCSEIQREQNASHGRAEAEREAAAKTALLATIAGSLVLLFFFVAGFQPLLSGGSQKSAEPRLPAYLAVLPVILVATLLRMSLTPLIGPTAAPFITYFPAVLFAAWYGGFRTGAFAILLSTAATWYYFVSAERSFLIVNPGDLIGILLFIFVSFGIALLSDSQRQAVAQRRAAENAEHDLRVRFEQLNQELARSNEDLQAFAAMASHDLKEPLRMIAAYSQLLIRKYPAQSDSDARLFVENIVDGVSRMQRLLSDLLALAEIDARIQEPPEPVDVSRVIESAVRNLKEAIDSSGATIDCELLPHAGAAESHLVSLFQNLIGNAIKYRGAEPVRVRISAEAQGSRVRFAVSDNGIGIAPEYHDKVFAAFQRLHGKKVPGSGIGLATCKRIVERYGGRIWVESGEGRGATFYFTLPSAAAPASLARGASTTLSPPVRFA